jgi:hypothetical protein
MAADTSDSFYRNAMADVSEMMEARFPEEVKVIVHADAPSPWKGQCWRVKGASQGNGGHGATPKGNAYVSKDCHHNGVLDFIKQSIEESDSEYYLLVLWGHGEGIDWKQKVIGPNVQTAVVNKRFAPGSQNAVEVGDLGEALTGLELKNASGEKLNRDNVVVGFDACLMGMVEVYNEIQKHVRWGFATSDEIPVTGWPYKEVLNLLGKDPKIDARSLAEKLVETCSTWYSDNSPDTKIGFATCDLSDSGSILEGMKKLTIELRKHIRDSKIWQAVRDARDFAEDLGEVAYVDLHAFCSALTRQIGPLGYAAALEDAAKTLNSTVDKFVVKHDFSNCYPGVYVKVSRSLSICFPQSAELVGSIPDLVVNWGSYRNLEFSKTTNWPCFLEEFWDVQRSTDRRKSSVMVKAAKAAGG